GARCAPGTFDSGSRRVVIHAEEETQVRDRSSKQVQHARKLLAFERPTCGSSRIPRTARAGRTVEPGSTASEQAPRLGRPGRARRVAAPAGNPSPRRPALFMDAAAGTLRRASAPAPWGRPAVIPRGRGHLRAREAVGAQPASTYDSPGAARSGREPPTE